MSCNTLIVDVENQTSYYIAKPIELIDLTPRRSNRAHKPVFRLTYNKQFEQCYSHTINDMSLLGANPCLK